MKKVLRHAVPAALALAFLSTTAFAQTEAASAPAAAPAAASAPAPAKHMKKRPMHKMQPADFVEQRLGALHTQLQITADEMPQWEAFAQTMRDSATKTQQAYHDRSEQLSTMTADDAMKSYAELAQMHADNTQKLATAFSTLYAALSDDQKKTADVLFRDQYAHRHTDRKHRAPHAAAGASATPATAAPASAASN